MKVIDRHLDWEGCWNARDLGGLKTRDGRRLRRSAIVRASTFHTLTPRGWDDVVDYGVRTVIDLRDSEQRAERPTEPPDIVDDVHLPLEEDLLGNDSEFLAMARKGWLSTPLYYPYFAERWPGRLARTVDAVANAGPGGVVIHCSAGRDRTGLITTLLLSLVDVAPETIAADHELSMERLQTEDARKLDVRDETEAIRACLEGQSTTLRQALLDFVRPLDAAGLLREAGLSQDSLRRVRARLL